MAINEWRGDAAAVAQVSTVVVDAVGMPGNKLIGEVNKKQATYTIVTGDTAATAAAKWVSAIAAARELYPEFGEFEIEYTEGDALFRLVAAEPGVPFVFGASATGTAAVEAAVDTPSRGPNHVDDANNWSLGTTPTNDTDTIVVNGGASMLYGFDTYGLRGLSFEVRAGFTNDIGLPKWNPAGYYEYRMRQFEVKPATIIIRGGGQLKFLAKDSQVWRVEATGNAQDDETPALCIELLNAPESIRISGASNVGIQWEREADARTLALVKQTGSDSLVRLGRNLTVTSYDKDAGELESFAAITTLTNATGGATLADGGVTNLVAYSGTVRLNVAGTIASVVATGTGPDEAPVIDCEGNDRARTFTASSFSGGACLYDANRTVTTGGGTHTADATFFLNSRLGPSVSWSR